MNILGLLLLFLLLLPLIVDLMSAPMCLGLTGTLAACRVPAPFLNPICMPLACLRIQPVNATLYLYAAISACIMAVFLFQPAAVCPEERAHPAVSLGPCMCMHVAVCMLRLAQGLGHLLADSVPMEFWLRCCGLLV